MNVLYFFMFIAAFGMGILFFWATIKTVNLTRKKQPFRSMKKYFFAALISLVFMIVFIAISRSILPILLIVVGMTVYLSVSAIIMLIPTIKNKQPVRWPSFVILFLALAFIDALICLFLGVFAGLGHSSTEIALWPVKCLLSTMLVVVLPLVLLASYNYFGPSGTGKNKKAAVVFTAVFIILAALVGFLRLEIDRVRDSRVTGRLPLKQGGKIRVKPPKKPKTLPPKKPAYLKPEKVIVEQDPKKHQEDSSRQMREWYIDRMPEGNLKTLFSAILEGEPKTVEDLLKKQSADGVDIDARADTTNGGGALAWACYCNRPRIAVLLLKYGADVNARSDHKLTPLMEATRDGYLDVARILIQKGADVNAASKKGWTPLMWAAKAGHLEIVRLLLRSGANVNAKNRRNETALQIAQKKGHPMVVNLLGKEVRSSGTD